MDTQEPVKRDVDIEELTNLHLIHPMSSRLALGLARLRVKPNWVSFAGMACGLLAGWAYFHYQHTGWVVAGFALMIAWHVLDGADGQLARLTRTQSEFGKIIDGICDYVTFIAVYLGLGLALAAEHGGRVWLLIVAAGLAHAIQAAAYEVQRQEYNYWGRGRLSAALPSVVELRAAPQPTAALSRALQGLYRLYVALQNGIAGMPASLRGRLVSALCEEEPRAQALRERYRRHFAPSVRRWAVMSANYRTLGIFVASLCGVPLIYFAVELLGLSALMVVLLVLQRVLYRRFARDPAVLDALREPVEGAQAARR